MIYSPPVSYLELPPVDRARRALADLGRAPDRVAELFEEMSNWEMLWTPEPGKAWSCVEILGHLVDFEVVCGVRIRSALAEPGKPQGSFDQDRWVGAQRWGRRSPDDLLDGFSALRRLHVSLLSDLSEEELELHFEHPVHGRRTVAEVAVGMQEHDARHLVQLGRQAEQARQARSVA